eukprot:scaffold827_cov369-Prasinococcus_capsulatus_cf.AAC.17
MSRQPAAHRAVGGDTMDSGAVTAHRPVLSRHVTPTRPPPVSSPPPGALRPGGLLSAQRRFAAVVRTAPSPEESLAPGARRREAAGGDRQTDFALHCTPPRCEWGPRALLLLRKPPPSSRRCATDEGYSAGELARGRLTPPAHGGAATASWLKAPSLCPMSSAFARLCVAALLLACLRLHVAAGVQSAAPAWDERPVQVVQMLGLRPYNLTADLLDKDSADIAGDLFFLLGDRITNPLRCQQEPESPLCGCEVTCEDNVYTL